LGEVSRSSVLSDELVQVAAGGRGSTPSGSRTYVKPCLPRARRHPVRFVFAAAEPVEAGEGSAAALTVLDREASALRAGFSLKEVLCAATCGSRTAATCGGSGCGCGPSIAGSRRSS